MSTMQDVEWLPPLVEPHRDAVRMARIKARGGNVTGATDYFMTSDWLPEANAELNARVANQPVMGIIDL